MNNIDINALCKSYLCHDLMDEISGAQLLSESIATVENYFNYMSDEEILHRQRVLAVAYLALKRWEKTTKCAHWNVDKFGDKICSHCGAEAPNDGRYESPYCYECGCKMR